MATSTSDGESSDAGPPEDPARAGSDERYDRRRALIYSAPFLALGLADLLLLLFWGLEPLWGFVILMPITFMTVLTYIAFRTDFLEDRT